MTMDGKRIAILAADGVEKIELEQPRDALQQQGARIDIVSLKDAEIEARNHDLESAGTIKVDRTVSVASPADYDGLVLPGGTVNPDKLRMDETAVSFVRTSWNPESRLPQYVMARGPCWKRAWSPDAN